MCTAISFLSKNHYFGRNLDFEYSYNERITITPRSFPLRFRKKATITNHYAIIGMATVDCGYPLYFDGTNECGLSMAGLYFPGNAVYLPEAQGKDNITPFEFIPWILAQCKNINEAVAAVQNINLVKIPYNDKYPLSPLHWIIADRESSVTVEPAKNGVEIYNNPVGVLTNNPPFKFHLHNLANYINLTRDEPTNRFAQELEIKPYSKGMGAIGLPGDLSSASRFVRAAFTKLNSVCKPSESSSVSQFFHILDSVAQFRGCVKTADGYEKTIYSSCCNTDEGIYYYKTYENSQITGVSLNNTELNGSKLLEFPLVIGQNFRMEN